MESDAMWLKRPILYAPSRDPGSDEGDLSGMMKAGTVYIGEGCWGAPCAKITMTNPGPAPAVALISLNGSSSTRKNRSGPFRTDGALRVAEVSHNNIFEPPVGLVIWNPPSGGDVYDIQSPWRFPIPPRSCPPAVCEDGIPFAFNPVPRPGCRQQQPPSIP